MESLREQMLRQLAEGGWPFETITCDDCADKDSCEWAYDLYNTDGDCLATK